VRLPAGEALKTWEKAKKPKDLKRTDGPLKSATGNRRTGSAKTRAIGKTTPTCYVRERKSFTDGFLKKLWRGRGAGRKRRLSKTEY